MTDDLKRHDDDNIQHGIDDNPEGDAAKGAALGGVGGAAVGAAAGAPAGPVGMAVGALVGAVAGAVASGAAVAAVDSMDNDDTMTGLGDGTPRDAKDRTPDRDARLSGSGTLDIQSEGETMDGRSDTRGLMDETADTLTARTEGEIRVPVVEETAEVRKEAREAGEVTLRKEVEVETQRISQPVSHTEVEVERRAVAPGEAADLDPNAPTLRDGETLRIPVIEEELEVRKVPKVTGEVVVRTRQETEQAEQDVHLRKEHVDVDRTGEVRAEGLDDLDENRDLDVDLDTTPSRSRGTF